MGYIQPMEKGKKINLGCGKRDFGKGWINIDLADFPHIHYRQNINDLSNFEDNSIELIHCSHALEYFDRQEGLLALKEWYRVLQPGGILRVAVPDFQALITVYRESGLGAILGPLYGRMECNEGYIYHKTVYDFNDLYRLLEEAGFSTIQKYDWRTTDYADFDDHSQAYFPHLAKDTGLLVSLNMEATK